MLPWHDPFLIAALSFPIQSQINTALQQYQQQQQQQPPPQQPPQQQLYNVPHQVKQAYHALILLCHSVTKDYVVLCRGLLRIFGVFSYE